MYDFLVEFDNFLMPKYENQGHPLLPEPIPGHQSSQAKPIQAKPANGARATGLRQGVGGQSMKIKAAPLLQPDSRISSRNVMIFQVIWRLP